jgi:hypothetical protein
MLLKTAQGRAGWECVAANRARGLLPRQPKRRAGGYGRGSSTGARQLVLAMLVDMRESCFRELEQGETGVSKGLQSGGGGMSS